MPPFWSKSNKSQQSLEKASTQTVSHFEEREPIPTNYHYSRPEQQQQQRYDQTVQSQAPYPGYTVPRTDRPPVYYIQPDHAPEIQRSQQYPSSPTYSEAYSPSQELIRGFQSKPAHISKGETVPQGGSDNTLPLKRGKSVSYRTKDSTGPRQSPTRAEAPTREDLLSRRRSTHQPRSPKLPAEPLPSHPYLSRFDQGHPIAPPHHTQAGPEYSSQPRRQVHPPAALQRSGTDSHLLHLVRAGDGHYSPSRASIGNEQFQFDYPRQRHQSQQPVYQSHQGVRSAQQDIFPRGKQEHPADAGIPVRTSQYSQQEHHYPRSSSQQSQNGISSTKQQYQAYASGIHTRSRGDILEPAQRPPSQLSGVPSGSPVAQDSRFSMAGVKPRQADSLLKEGPNVEDQAKDDQDSDESPSIYGLSSFRTSVVPTAVQSQPYKSLNQDGDREGQPEAAQRSAPNAAQGDIVTILQEHLALKDKYNKVKLKYFEKEKHVEDLQNILASQRLSQSKTSLDDSGYMTKFNQLDGLVGQVAFSIKKDWKQVPAWLQSCVNKDATALGAREMIGVGKAFISRWLMDDLFDKYFHPGLEPSLSCQLKLIQNNIRAFAPMPQSNEEYEGLDSKLISWRLATVEGLQDVLNSKQSSVNQQTLVDSLNEKLLAALQMHLKEPMPIGIENGTMMIIQRAIDIAQHLPRESREVHIEYVLPGHSIVPEYMKVESGIAPLMMAVDGSEADKASLKSVASDKRDSDVRDAEHGSAGQQDARKKGIFGGRMGSKRGAGLGQQKPRAAGAAQTSMAQKEEAVQRVRFSTFLAVRIRNRLVLVKAPVYTM